MSVKLKNIQSISDIGRIYVGDNGVAKEVLNGWVGADGVARRFYSKDADAYSDNYFSFTMQGVCKLYVDGFGLTIDYGDGVVEDMKSLQRIQPEWTNNYRILSVDHVYTDNQNHHVKIYGAISLIYFCFSTDDTNPYLISVDSPFPKGNHINELRYCFYSCTSLVSVPDKLFENCFDPEIAYDCFHGCRSLQFIPDNLFHNCSRLSRIDNLFYGCTSLQFIPEGLFENCRNIATCSACFCGCSSLTGNAPSLWDTTKWPNVDSHSLCFGGCTSLSNYGDIPDGWK